MVKVGLYGVGEAWRDIGRWLSLLPAGSGDVPSGADVGV